MRNIANDKTGNGNSDDEYYEPDEEERKEERNLYQAYIHMPVCFHFRNTNNLDRDESRGRSLIHWLIHDLEVSRDMPRTPSQPKIPLPSIVKSLELKN